MSSLPDALANRWRLPISTYLGLGLGGLVTIALVLLLWITLSAIFKNTTELLNDKSRILLDTLTKQTSNFLDSSLAPTNVVARLIAEGRISPSDTDDLSRLLRTLLATTPQIDAIAYFDRDGTRTAAFREQGHIESDRQPWPDRSEIGDALADVEERKIGIWGPPVYAPDFGAFLNFRRPVFRGETFEGMVTAVIKVRTLSEFLAGLETERGQNAFILYDRDYVLAHLSLASAFDGLSAGRPLPKVTEVGDPILFNIWREGWEDDKLIAGNGHADDSSEPVQIFLYAPLEEYADAPWLVGSYFSAEVIAIQFDRMIAASIASVVLVALTVIGTLLIGRFLRRPINQLAAAATKIQKLDLDAVPKLPPSRFAELDDASQAFNAMASGLRAFSHYVPRDLVNRLIARGDVNELGSEARTVTVLMTDIVGFTSRAERLGAAETAAFLNHHLGLVTSAIEAEGGIVDKYMGDAVMALWGAIEDEPDHAARSVAAARRICQTIRDDNADNGDPVRLRIGIHSGPVIVGNIGTATRMNYTVIGDTVNIAQRLEALGKSLLPAHETAVLISAETVKAVPSSVKLTSLGCHAIRGRTQQAEVFTLAKY